MDKPIVTRAWLVMAVLAVGLMIGVNDGTHIEVSTRMDRTTLDMGGSIMVRGTGEVDREVASYGYVAFAYAIGLGPRGEEVAGRLDDIQEQRLLYPTTSQGDYRGYPSRGAPDIQSLACRPEFQWSCTWILRVIDCESTFRPVVVGSERVDGVDYYFYGLLQIHHPDPPGPTNVYLLQPYLNLIEGHIQYVEWQEGNRSDPWPNCP